MYHILSILIFLFASGASWAKVMRNLKTVNQFQGIGPLQYMISLRQTIKCLKRAAYEAQPA